jgi:hypothetical protein
LNGDSAKGLKQDLKHLQRTGIPNVIFSDIQPQRCGAKNESESRQKVAHAVLAWVFYRVVSSR